MILIDAMRRKATIDVLETAFVQLGFQDMYQVITIICGFVDKAYPVLRASASRQSLEEYLKPFGNTEEASIDQLLPLVLAAPRLLEVFITSAVRETAAKLPGPPVGRPVALTPERRRVIVDLVSDLLKKSGSLGAAQLRASQQLGLSRRTIQRAWKEREELPDKTPPTLAELWRLFETSVPR